MTWVVTAPSAYRMGHTCLLGSGATREAALSDAYGPKPWGPAALKSQRIATVHEVADEEAERLESEAH